MSDPESVPDPQDIQNVLVLSNLELGPAFSTHAASPEGLRTVRRPLGRALRN